MLIVAAIVLTLFLYWKFVCWVATRTNVSSCMTMFVVASLADALVLRGGTGVAMLLLALLRVDVGNLIGQASVSSEDFKALKSGAIKQ